MRFLGKISLVAMVCLLVLIGQGSQAGAQDCTTENISTEKALLKEIKAANTRASASVLCLEPGTTLTLTTLSVPNNDSGDNYLPLIESDITLVGGGSTLQPAENGPLGRFVRVRGKTAKLTIIDMTLTGWESSEQSDGSVFRVDEGTLVIEDSTFTTNAARRGGVIFNNTGTIFIKNSTFSDNSAVQTGGVIDSVGTLSIVDSTLSHNTAHGVGGALYLYNVPDTPTGATLTRVTLIENNSAQDGGALYFAAAEEGNDLGTLTIEDSELTQNTAAKEGGALNLAAGTTTVTNTMFDSNAVIVEDSNGGAVHVSATASALNVVESTFQNNLATLRGGAIHAYGNSVSITGGLFSSNQVSAPDGDGGAVFADADEANSDDLSLTIDGVQFIDNAAPDEGSAVGVGFVKGHLTGSCLTRNSVGTAVWSSVPGFEANGNWWEAVPRVNDNVTADDLLSTCPLTDLEPLPLVVTGFTLIDGTSDEIIAPLVDGDIIDRRGMPGITLRVGIEIDPKVTGSVVFELNDEVYSTDDMPEYRLAATWAAEPGVYHIKATPYTGPDGSGIMGTPKMLTFTIIDYLISDPVLRNGKTYARAILDIGQHIYVDRDYVITNADDLFIGREFIQAVNNDKEVAEPNFMTFELLCDATVYIGYDTRLPEPPWFEGWSLTNAILIASDTTGEPIRSMYERDFPAGTVVLGSNYGVVDSYTYTVIAVPHDQCHVEE